MYRIAKSFTFSASHQIEELPEHHKCRRLHGHNYTVEFILESKILDHTGMVWDYGRFSIAEVVVNKLDHTHLNDSLKSTTAESLAKHFYSSMKTAMPGLSTVRVSEGPRTWAEYSE